MNYPVWQVPASGLVIAFVAIVHVFVSHFAIGGGLFLVLAERRARASRDEALLAFVRSLSRAFVLLTLVFGALTGVGIWFTIGLVSPQATSMLIQAFVWVWAIEWIFFFVEIAAALVYYYGWDRLDPRTHLAVGWVYFASAWLSLVAINGILTFMLTSGDWPLTHRLADGFFNPTYLPVTVLRTALAIGLAGLYALLAAAFVRDGDLKERIVRWASLRWILPAALAVPAALVWSLACAAQAGVPVAEILGASRPGAFGLLVALFDPAAPGGHPIVRLAGAASIVASLLLALGALLVVTFRACRLGRIEAGLLMSCGLVAMGGGEWVREGLRKPYAIDRVLFVNGIRLPPVAGSAWAGRVADPLAVDALRQRGALATSLWVQRAGDDLERGRTLFELQCATCHTLGGHLGLRRLVAGKGVTALEQTIDGLARPVGPDGRAVDWDAPQLRLQTWLGRRMPPFAGTADERRVLALFLASLNGPAAVSTPGASEAPAGVTAFEQHCSSCHGPEAPWPIGSRLAGRDVAAFYALIGRLPEVRAEMPPFEGSETERRALAEYLGALARKGSQR